MTRFEQLGILMNQAAELGAQFHILGDAVECHGDLPEALAQQLARYADLLPSYLDIHADDCEAIAFFEKLGVGLVHVTASAGVESALQVLDADAAISKLPIAIDIETTPKGPPAPRIAVLTKNGGLHGSPPKPENNLASLSPYTGRIATMQLYSGGDSVFVFTGEALQALLKDTWLRTRNFVAHSVGFELSWLRWAVKELHALPLLPWQEPGRWHCTQQAAGLVIGVGFNGSLRSLAAVSERLLGLKPPKALQLSNWGLQKLTRGQLCYAASDPILTHCIWAILTEELTRLDRRTAYRLQLRCIDAVGAMELRGVGIDRAEFNRQLDEWTRELSEARVAYKERTGAPAPTNHKEVRAWLKRALSPDDLTRWPKTSSGQLRVDADNLKRLHALPETWSVLRILALSKLLQAFGESFIEKLNPVTGRFHAQFNIAAAETGRFSCRQPNLQQLPHRRAPAFRKCIVARDGFMLVAADYSQVEVRIAAWRSRDAALTGLIRDGLDIHRETAARIAGISSDDVTDEQRRAAKACVFGAIYGVGPTTLVSYAHSAYDVEMSEEEARAALRLGSVPWGSVHRRTRHVSEPRNYIPILPPT
jgi:hypothetical protein